MPRGVNQTFTTEKSKAQNAPLFLYTITSYNGTEDLHWSGNQKDIIYDGITYKAVPISHEFTGDNNQGRIDSVKVRLSNISRMIQFYLETHDFRGKDVRIRMVFADTLDDAEAYLDEIYTIDSYSADQNHAEFTLTGKFDVLGVNLPARGYTRNTCGWVFKSTECGYTGVETTCNKTQQECRDLGNHTRYGAFPSVPLRRAWIA